MPDLFDRAQALELERAEKINAQPKTPKASLTQCQECGIAMPHERIKMGGAVYCIDCQEEHEFIAACKARNGGKHEA